MPKYKIIVDARLSELNEIETSSDNRNAGFLERDHRQPVSTQNHMSTAEIENVVYRNLQI